MAGGDTAKARHKRLFVYDSVMVRPELRCGIVCRIGEALQTAFIACSLRGC